MTSDGNMADINNKNISDTPKNTFNMSASRNSNVSYDSTDSGYFALTPQSSIININNNINNTDYTPIVGGCRTRGCLASSKRHYRMRTDPLQSDNRLPRNLRSKLNNINGSDKIYDSTQIIDESLDIITSDGISQDSGNFSVEQISYDRNLSLENSINNVNDYNTEIRERITRNRRTWRNTDTPITPASRLQLLSPPPSPAVPSSSFVASEPIDDNVKMKLIILPQSTPYTDTTNITNDINIACINYSPTTRRTSPIDITSVDNKKLSNLMINDLSNIVDIKPKRLDFSQRALSYALHRTRATPDYTGKDTVDLMSLLGEKSNHWRVVSKIFSHLSSQDLCSVSMVSQAWRRICANDSRANLRRLSHIILRQNAKENLKIIKKTKNDNDTNNSPKSCYVRKGCLIEVHNLLQIPTTPRPPNSPPVSPSKVKFHSFVKASRTLEPWEHLLPCPNCSFPCHVDCEKNVGKCSRQGCSMEFCTSCSSRSHSGPCKTPLLATPTKRNKRLIVGSRQSKRNLRRL